MGKRFKNADWVYAKIKKCANLSLIIWKKNKYKHNLKNRKIFGNKVESGPFYARRYRSIIYLIIFLMEEEVASKEGDSLQHSSISGDMPEVRLIKKRRVNSAIFYSILVIWNFDIPFWPQSTVTMVYRSYVSLNAKTVLLSPSLSNS